MWLSKGPAYTLELLGGVDGSLGRGRGTTSGPFVWALLRRTAVPLCIYFQGRHLREVAGPGSVLRFPGLQSLPPRFRGEGSRGLASSSLEAFNLSLRALRESPPKLVSLGIMFTFSGHVWC